MVEVRRINDKFVTIKLIVRGLTLNIISGSLDKEVKKHF